MNKVAVIGGAGHVGLPLSLVIAESGLETIVIDINEEKINSIRNGDFPFVERGGQELLDKSKDFPISYTTEYSVLKECDVIILTIGTPIDEYHNPDLSPVYKTIDQLKPYLKDGQVLVLRSTLFPGTSEKIFARLQQEGMKISVSFCPERIAQGYALEEIKCLPQIVSGSDSHAIDTAKTLFLRFVSEVIELELAEAELAKLYTNVWRYITFAVANQFYIIAEEKGFDFFKIRKAIMHNYERASNFPKSGLAAGPCLFKDTMQLEAFSRKNFNLGTAAMHINEILPNFLVDRVKLKHDLSFIKVGILGMAFKPNNDDFRESLAYKLRKTLTYENAIVMCTDPYIDDPSFFKLNDVLSQCDLIFIGCPHDEYKNLDLSEIEIVDCWEFQES
jgi:UDP-N-acetyl-D-mannosaminuronic acid dehydrogenase